MSLLDPINNYCERLGPGLLAEPLNALSNAAFFIAAWLLWKQYKASGSTDRKSAWLIILVFIVGTGSTLFHTFANKLTMLADVIPIMVFVCSYLYISTRYLLHCPLWFSSLCVGAVLIAGAGMGNVIPPSMFNGSAPYFPCLAAVLIIGARLKMLNHPSTLLFLQAGGIFFLSLIFRSLDMTLCPSWPLGVHFLWHSLNGVVLYLLTKAIIGVKSSQ